MLCEVGPISRLQFNNMILYKMLGNAASSQGKRKKSALERQLGRKTHGGIQLMEEKERGEVSSGRVG